MQTQIAPYLNFKGTCREAMTFYQQCLGGELMLQTVGESPIADQCPTAMQDQILHSTLTKGAWTIMGSDMQGPGGFVEGNSIAISVSCSSEEEINRFYNNLSVGGSIHDPLKVQFWGALFGVVADKFGVRWMFNYDKNRQ